jgi:site-specific recombinase XerD
MTLVAVPGSQYWHCDILVGGDRVKKSTKVKRPPDSAGKRAATEARKAALAVEEEYRQDKIKEQREAARREAAGFTEDILLSAAVKRMYNTRWHEKADGEAMRKKMEWVVSQVGDPMLSKVNEEFVDKMVEKLRSCGRQPATINRYKAHLRIIMRHAVLKWRVPARIPSMDMSDETEGRMFVLTEDQEAKLTLTLRAAPVAETQGRQYAEYPGYADLFEVLVDTGLRLGEARQITFSRHIDLEVGEIRLDGVMCKSGKGRVIPMTNRVKNILTERKALGVDLAFPWSHSRVEQVWNGLVRKRMNIADPEFCIHCLRHTFASRLVRKGVDLYVVKKLMGHASISTTERYAKLQTANLADAVKLL